MFGLDFRPLYVWVFSFVPSCQLSFMHPSTVRILEMLQDNVNGFGGIFVPAIPIPVDNVGKYVGGSNV